MKDVKKSGNRQCKNIRTGIEDSKLDGFIKSNTISILWVLFSIYISTPWLKDLSKIVGMPAAIVVITGIAYIPGFLNSFLVTGLVINKPKRFKDENPNTGVTVLIAARNEEIQIGRTLKYISKQDYKGNIKVIVIDNNSMDDTSNAAADAAKKLNIDVKIINEPKPGKFNALNSALKMVKTGLVITLDADTLLHKSAVRYLVARIKSSPKETCAVAGSVLVQNGKENIITKVQFWDYFLGIASIKRLQGFYNSTLVAQGAFSIYKISCLKKVGGWPDAIGEDIVLTWKMLEQGNSVRFEPLAVAFTSVPNTLKVFSRQRSRWARGMIEALKTVKPWEQSGFYTKYLTGINLVMPYLDLTYTICWIPGLIMALFGVYWIVGVTALLVLPLTILSFLILFYHQKKVFDELDIKIGGNAIGLVFFILVYQSIMSPVSVYGYCQEFFKLKRVWK